MKDEGLCLARLENGIVVEKPKDEDDSIHLILQGGYLCSCPQHNSHAHGRCKGRHGQSLLTPPGKDLKESKALNLLRKYDISDHQTLHPGASHEATHLSALVTKFSMRPKEEMNRQQWVARRRLLRIESFDDLKVLNAQDIPHSRMMDILDIFSALFFFSSLNVPRFE